jgi:hypothetical protein
VGAQFNAALHAGLHRGVHDARVAGVEAARDVRGGDQAQEGVVVADGVVAVAFAEVRDDGD